MILASLESKVSKTYKVEHFRYIKFIRINTMTMQTIFTVTSIMSNCPANSAIYILISLHFPPGVHSSYFLLKKEYGSILWFALHFRGKKIILIGREITGISYEREDLNQRCWIYFMLAMILSFGMKRDILMIIFLVI